MTKKLTNKTLAARIDQLATKHQVQELARTTAANFEQVVVSLIAALKLMQKEMRRNARRNRRYATRA